MIIFHQLSKAQPEMFDNTGLYKGTESAKLESYQDNLSTAGVFRATTVFPSIVFPGCLQGKVRLL